MKIYNMYENFTDKYSLEIITIMPFLVVFCISYPYNGFFMSILITIFALLISIIPAFNILFPLITIIILFILHKFILFMLKRLKL